VDPEGGREGVVLVVDDDQAIRETLEMALQEHDIRTAAAADGEAALAWLKQNSPPRLILLDLMMPVLDGWQVIERLREDERLARVPVVVITAFSRDLGSAARLPVLRKPIELRDLLNVTNRYGAPGLQ
jgi:two-component system chemotaxis response regulator CheY